LVPNGLVPHPGSPVNGRLLPEFILAVRCRALLRPPRGLLRWLPPSARGLLQSLLGSPVPGLQRARLQEYRFPRLRHLSTRRHGISHRRWLRLLLEVTCTRAVYSPSTTVASGNAASTAGASDSA
jgi:hypothetical protein